MRLPKRKPGKYQEGQTDPFLTQEKFEELGAELKKLKAKRPKAAAEVARLSELGDFSENVEYQLAKRRLRGLNAAILKLEYQLDHAQIISPEKNMERVQLGSTVTVETGGLQKTYQILGSTETDPKKGIISQNSPIGAALLGRRVGETVTVTVGGKEVVFRIVKIAS